MLMLTGLAAMAQSGAGPSQSEAKADSALLKALEAVKNLEERVALLEQELVEVRLQARGGAGAAQAEAAGDGPVRRPQVEDEEPFDAAKHEAADEAEVAAVAKAVSVLLPANVKQATSIQGATGAGPATRASGLQMAVQAGGPKPLRRVEPLIPASMRNSIPGEVTVSVKVYVGANGEVMGTVPVRQGEPTADQIGILAAEAVTRWRFEPVLQNGQPVATQTMVRFRLAK